MAKPTAKDKEHFALVAELGCMACGAWQAEIHHSRDGLGMGQRDHTKVYGLCPNCHRHSKESRHLSPKLFAETHGTDTELVEKVHSLL